MKYIDKFLNSITMYRLVLYILSLLALAAIVLGYARVIPYWGTELIISLAIILTTVYFSNKVFTRLFKAAANVESFWITGFILFFLLQPLITGKGLLVLVGAGIIAMLSKYILAIRKKHIFNPSAVTAVILGLAGSGMVIWWVASPILNILTLVCGLLIVRKLRRSKMFFAFLISSIVLAVFVYIIPSHISAIAFIKEVLFSWQLIFFATVMFTEPLTSPTNRNMQIVYGIIVGLLFSSQLHVGSVYVTPELALVIGNIFAYAVNSKQKLMLKYVSQEKLTANVYQVRFEPNQKLHFTAGQYLEWTLPHDKPDTRGNRRYFTIASSPTENDIRLGIRFDSVASSTFKKKLISLRPGEFVTAGQLAGDFVLPKDTSKKLAFIAGGIGVTPFRSMVTYLVDTKQKRDITLFYQSAKETDFAYGDYFENVKAAIGMQTVYVVSNPTEQWKGKTGRLTPELIKETLSDFASRMFYLSGPEAMVENYKKMLHGIGVVDSSIKTDYFPGY